MYYEELNQMDCIPGRAPSDFVWERIEKHLDHKVARQHAVPAWFYAAALLSLNIIAGMVLSTYFS
jgi:hypothetical protein